MDLKVRKPPQTTARMDIEQMPETPQRWSHHRRSQSDTSFRFANIEDDLLLFDPSDLDLSTQLPNSNSHEDNPARSGVFHSRSLSMDSDFFDGFGIAGDADVLAGGTAKMDQDHNKIMARHSHSNSMDGFMFDADSTSLMDTGKKISGPHKLPHLALIDPKRAKRILANRQSAARSKERKIRYTNELEKKVQMLQSEATSLSAQLTVLQRDTAGLTAENRELKLRLQAMEQQAQLRDALNETLKEEVQRLKMTAPNDNFLYRVVLPPPFPTLQPSLHQFGDAQNHQQQQLLPMSQPDSRGSASSHLPGV